MAGVVDQIGSAQLSLEQSELRPLGERDDACLPPIECQSTALESDRIVLRGRRCPDDLETVSFAPADYGNLSSGAGGEPGEEAGEEACIRLTPDPSPSLRSVEGSSASRIKQNINIPLLLTKEGEGVRG
ncbi:hypothetical protein A3J34_00200 [Candidatus Peribacteria bacterium RIFCSPLOWO2_02_FULL_51_10]|nr:MAG: hypothetical protein A3J34_00200 [Candidatus Peribacteria bacterium RIFCSPLOWO2_02_FULL_51_10]